jgi:hypothetical protein
LCSCVEYVFTDFVAEPAAVETVKSVSRVQRIKQLFDSLDPSPFREKSLDADVETYLRDCAGERAPSTRLRSHIHAPPELRAWPPTSSRPSIRIPTSCSRPRVIVAPASGAGRHRD